MPSRQEILRFQLAAQTAARHGISQLLAGDLEQGFKNYTARTCVHWFDRRHKNMPVWKGQIEPGKTLLLHYEQGIGEQIYFASVLPDLVATGMRIIYEVDERLVSIMQRSFPEVLVIPYQFPFHEVCYEADYQCQLGSAMRFFRKCFGDFPSKKGYLVPDPGLVATLEPFKGRIGLSWKSNAVKFAKHKNIPFELFDDFRVKYNPISVQYGAVSEDIERVQGLNITQNLENCAALLSVCSKVVSVSNAVAHMAGAVGTETHVLVPNGNNRHIYWYPERDTVPNYPSASAYMQMPPGQWKPLVDYITNKRLDNS